MLGYYQFEDEKSEESWIQQICLIILSKDKIRAKERRKPRLY